MSENIAAFKQVINKFVAAYGSKHWDAANDSDQAREAQKDKFRLWQGQLSHLNPEALLATADAAIANHKWHPSLSEFLEISRSVRKQQEEMARPAPRRLEDHIAELQDKGLSVQRALLKLRAEAGLKHDHRGGWEKCPVCSQATCENDADECRTCMTLGANGFPEKHYASS